MQSVIFLDNMIKEIIKIIDHIIETGVDNPRLYELILKVIIDDKKFPEKLVEICYQIHEEDSYTDDSEEGQKEGLRTFKNFIDFLKKIKQENIELWKVMGISGSDTLLSL